MLAEQCNRFEEMVEFLEDLLKTRTGDLNSDERNLLSIAYKNSISSRRTALRTIMAYETKESKKDKSSFLEYIKEYKMQVNQEFNEKCKKIITTIDEKLIPKAGGDKEAIVFYIKMKGDYNRYIAEYAEGDEKAKVSDAALAAYGEATNIAKDLPVLNPIALGLALNFSVFYYEVKNDHAKAMQIAKETIEKADKELPSIDEEADAWTDDCFRCDCGGGGRVGTWRMSLFEWRRHVAFRWTEGSRNFGRLADALRYGVFFQGKQSSVFVQGPAQSGVRTHRTFVWFTGLFKRRLHR